MRNSGESTCHMQVVHSAGVTSQQAGMLVLQMMQGRGQSQFQSLPGQYNLMCWQEAMQKYTGRQVSPILRNTMQTMKLDITRKVHAYNCAARM